VACVNRIRGLLGEYGLVFPKGPAALEAVLTQTIEDAANEMNALARLVVRQAQTQWRELDAHIAWCDARIAAHVKANDDVKKDTKLMGIGPIGASASVATRGLLAVQERRTVRGLDGAGAAPAFVGWQEQPGRHHQER
jgi:transposase